MSTAAPIKFRCFQCHKLLGVSPSKVGAVVACPRCAAELIVPDPAEEPDDADGPSSVEMAPPPQPTPPPAPAPPPATVAPKTSSSSRIAPAVVPWDAHPEPDPEPGPERLAPSAATEPAFTAIRLEPVSLRPDPPRSRPEPRPSPPREEVVLPRIEVDPPSLREGAAPRVAPAAGLAREAGARRNDVTLPRTAVVLWSLLVLLAVVSAFVAGLLVGRFVWATGLPVASSAAVRNG